MFCKSKIVPLIKVNIDIHKSRFKPGKSKLCGQEQIFALTGYPVQCYTIKSGENLPEPETPVTGYPVQS